MAPLGEEPKGNEDGTGELVYLVSSQVADDYKEESRFAWTPENARTCALPGKKVEPC
jgi:hypothetical protein